ncbi:uncharacterized protein LOC131145659 [Malania oleifera]|uniref:uncharacterized protein LOC131145659 n=1 Tax=Malania oleifera TaxID=397392 RepID=UPI0025AE9FC2|nr:uncharacterized protein LOC131145659 [Malania oleifera]
MKRAAVYTLLVAVFVLLLLLLSRTIPPRPHLRLGRRFGSYKHAAFDPLVSEMEASINMTSENLISPPAVATAVNFDENGRLNITFRLMVLFPLIDKDPRDGAVSCKELEAWNVQQAMDRLNYMTQKELASLDKDGDEKISLRECLHKFSDEDIEKDNMGHGEPGWWKEQFNNADANQDGFLSFDELQDFLHPEDSKNEKIQEWLLREKIKRMDYDDDGKLNFVEFNKGPYNIYKSYAEFEGVGTVVPSPEEKFAELDVNKDKFLIEEELKPILKYLHPGELSYAKYYTNYLVHEADDNGDKSLSLEEMLNHEYIFYSVVFDDSAHDDDYYIHDEF